MAAATQVSCDALALQHICLSCQMLQLSKSRTHKYLRMPSLRQSATFRLALYKQNNALPFDKILVSISTHRLSGALLCR